MAELPKLPSGSMRYVVPPERPPTRRIGPLGRCIYCGRRAPERKLTEEHVLADGLGGWLAIVGSSCTACAEIIRPFETKVINNNFGLVRTAYGILSSKNPNRQKLAPDLQIPHAAILQHFGRYKRATILTGEDPRDRKPGFSLSRLDTVSPRLERPFNFLLGSVDGLSFFRFLAKTAHCAAYAASLHGGFKPYLLDLILKGSGGLVEAATYIGTIDEIVQQDDSILHAIDIDVVETETYLPLLGGVRKKLIVAKINLFVNHVSHPTYEVVVGEYDPNEVRILPRHTPQTRPRHRKGSRTSS